MLDKNYFRVNILEDINKFARDNKKNLNLILNIENLNLFLDANIIAIYYPLRSEPDLLRLVQIYQKKRFLYPYIDTSNKLQFSESKVFKKNNGFYEPKNKIPANPKTIDLFFVPGLAFDTNLNRLGRGLGYYDNFFICNTKCSKIGVCFDKYLLNNIPHTHKDIKMDNIVTEHQII